MSKDDLLRQLCPKSVHFDGYNLVGCKEVRGSPFFFEHSIELGDKYILNLSYGNEDNVNLSFQSVCYQAKVKFKTYSLSFDEYVNKLKEALKTNSDFITFKIATEFMQNEHFCSRCQYVNNDCVEMRKIHPKTVMAAVSFDLDEVRRALAEYHGIITKNKGGSKMKKNNFYGVDFDYGANRDDDLAATLLGVAVRDSQKGTWWTYDPIKKVHKNLANVKIGSFPIFLLPATNVQPGDMIKKDGKYFWIREVTADGTFKAIGALDGQVHEILPTESLIAGFNFYTKVVAMDVNALKDQSGNGVANNLLSAMLLMQWSKNDDKAEFSLDNLGEDSFNGMGAMLPLVLAQSSAGGNISNIFGNGEGGINLPMLMMLGSADSDAPDWMQMYVLTQLLNNGNTGLDGLFPGLGGTAQPQKMAPMSADVICEKCGATYSADTNFCPKCGGKTHPIKVGVKHCKKCGVELMADADYCHKCGTYNGATRCESCLAEIPEDAIFCPKCGKKVNEEEEKQDK